MRRFDDFVLVLKISGVLEFYVRVDNRTIIEYRSKSLFVHEIENLKKKWRWPEFSLL